MKRKVMSPASEGLAAKTFDSKISSGWRRCGSRLQRKVTCPASVSIATKKFGAKSPSGWRHRSKRLERNVSSPSSISTEVNTPVSNSIDAKRFHPENPYGLSSCSQRLQSIVTSPDSSRTDVTIPTSDTTAVGMFCPDIPSPWRRLSPRLQNIPLSQRPFYGSCGRVSRDTKVWTCKENSERGSTSDSGTISSCAPSSDSTATEMFRPEIHSPRRRFSPRLHNIPLSQRPFYGSCGRVSRDTKVWTCRENSGRGSMSDSGTISSCAPSSDSTATKMFRPEIHSPRRRFSPRLQNIPLSQRPFYGSCGRTSRDTKVIKCWALKGVSGFLRDKYQLSRLEGQPKLIINQMTKVPSSSLGTVCMDVSAGQEEISIPAVNLIDDIPIAPSGFTYSKSIQIAENVDIPPNADGCNCKGNCINPRSCACARLNGSKFPYVHYGGGRLTRAKNVVFECGPNCGCGPDCRNRLSQRGIKYHLEVFRTEDKGWALRTRNFIPSGAPVCEYIGVLKRTKDLDNVDDNEYIFEIDCLHTIKGIEGRERRSGAVSGPLRNHLEKMDEAYFYRTPEFCIDASSVGNVSRFINHSCEPNLFVQCILSAHHDARLARLVFFASENIDPLQELTYDYGYLLDSVVSSDGKIRQQPCYCLTAECRKRLY